MEKKLALWNIAEQFESLIFYFDNFNLLQFDFTEIF